MTADLDAIAEDIAMAERSAEMARHVALDHGPQLLAEIERLRGREEWVKTHLKICAVSMRARGNGDGERDMLDILAALEREES